MPTVVKPQLPVDQYLLECARKIARDSEKPEKARAQTSVTLQRRFRGTSKSDLLGCFDVSNGEWAGDGPERTLLADMYGYHVVKPVVRANQSAMQQARPEITIDPTNERNPSIVGGAAVAAGIAKYLDNHPDYWSNRLESQVNQQIQLQPGCFIHVYHDPEAESDHNCVVEEWADEPQETPGEWACPYCLSSGPLFSEQMGSEDEDTVRCFKCGERAEIYKRPSTSDEPQFKTQQEYPAGDLLWDIVSSYQIRVDDRNTKNGNIRKARWLEHHFVIEHDDLQALVPYHPIKSATEWSYTLRWEYSLETGTDVYLKPWGSAGEQNEGERPHEGRWIYLRPAYYRNYVAPQDFCLNRGDGYAATRQDGEPMLVIKAGERLIDKFPKGFRFLVADDELLPRIEVADLRDEWSYMTFLNDSGSFWGQPASELNELQRAANNFWTLEVQHKETSSMATTIYDREFFDAATFEEQLSPTKPNVYIENGDDIRKHFAIEMPPQQTGAMEGMEFIKSIIGDVSGIQPATVGAAQPGVAYASQALQREQSLGLLTPSQQSKAECKVATFTQSLKVIQQTKPRSWFEYIATMYGEEWKEQDIEAFLDLNIARDLRIWYKEGSDQPQSLIQQELKYRQLLMDVAEIAKATGDPSILKPELVAKYAEKMGADYDFENVEEEQRLANVRYHRIKDWLDHNTDTQIPEKALVEIACADRSLMPMPRENHKVHIEVYHDRCVALLGEPDPNFPLISCLLEMISRHESGGVVQKQTDTSNEIEGQAPALAAQAAAAQAQGQAGAQSAQAEAEAKLKETAVKAQIDQQGKERLEAMKQAEAERERQHDAEKSGAEMALAAADIASKHPDNQPHPIHGIGESVNYKDMPPKAQAALLEEIGLPSEGTESVHPAKIAATKAKQTERRPLA